MKRVCRRCGNKFEAESLSIRYCPKCAEVVAIEMRTGKRLETRRAKSIFPKMRKCARCGKKFEALDARDRFCSAKCHDEQNAEYAKAVQTQFRKIKDRMPSFCESAVRRAIVILRTYLAQGDLTKSDLLVGMGEVKACLDKAADFNQMLAVI